PPAIRVVMENKIRKLVRVSPRLTGSLPAGLRLQSVKALPSEIMLEGPASVLSRIDSIRTEEIQLKLLNRSVTVTRKLEIPAHIRTVSGESVSLRVQLAK
nr:YbbR-like domain-containing protein [Geobacteraceae bacterium]